MLFVSGIVTVAVNAQSAWYSVCIASAAPSSTLSVCTNPLLTQDATFIGDELTSLAGYVGRMKEGQKGIFYMAADSKKTAEQAPFVEKLIAKGYEVLYLTEPIDEVAIANVGEFDGHKLVDVTREELEVDEDDKKKVRIMGVRQRLVQ